MPDRDRNHKGVITIQPTKTTHVDNGNGESCLSYEIYTYIQEKNIMRYIIAYCMYLQEHVCKFLRALFSYYPISKELIHFLSTRK